MATITNFVTSAVVNTPTTMIASGNQFGVVMINNEHATADLYVNVGAAAASTGTIAGLLIPAKATLAVPVHGESVSVASGTASVPVAYFAQID